MENNRIVTERYLHAGDGIMGEGDEAYIHYKVYNRNYWIYAVIVKLNEKTAVIRPKYNSCKSDEFLIHPKNIIKITDKDVPSEYVDLLLSGDIVEI